LPIHSGVANQTGSSGVGCSLQPIGRHGAPAGTRTPIDGLGNRNGHLRNLLVIRQTNAKQHVTKSINVQQSAYFGKKVHDFCHANDTQHVAALKLFGSYN